MLAFHFCLRFILPIYTAQAGKEFLWNTTSTCFNTKMSLLFLLVIIIKKLTSLQLFLLLSTNCIFHHTHTKTGVPKTSYTLQDTRYKIHVHTTHYRLIGSLLLQCCCNSADLYTKTNLLPDGKYVTSPLYVIYVINTAITATMQCQPCLCPQ